MARRKAKIDESESTTNAISQRRGHACATTRDPMPTSIRLEYDPLDPTFIPLHRAGIAGLLLQIRAMQILHEQTPENERSRYVTPEWGYLHGGRGLWVRFDENSFHAVMRERYQATWVVNAHSKEEHKRRVKKSAKPNGHKLRFVYEGETGEHPNVKYLYKDLSPHLRHFEAFGVESAWQEHYRRTCFASFFCIPQERPIFDVYGETDKAKKSDELWKAISSKREVELGKSLYPNSFKTDLKGVKLKDKGKRVLLLHFWSLVSTFFTPRTVKFDRNKDTKEIEIKDEYSQPVIAVPDVCNVRTYVDEFTGYLKELPAPIPTRSGRGFLPDAYISTPREASLAMFAASRMAHNRTITAGTIGARGADVCVYKKLQKQAEVVAVISEGLDEATVETYSRLLRDIQSFPYRAMRVENVLARRVWHDGFERLAAQYPLELFVATKRGGKRERLPHATQMAQSIRDDFDYYARKENRMNDEETNVPTLIHDLVGNYIRKRPYNKGRERISEERLNKLFEKKRKGQTLTDDEKKLLFEYNQARLEGVEQEFIDFRGRHDPQGFGNLFVERFFAVPYHITPAQIEMLQPYYEGDKWEIGRRLVLMSISSAGAPPKRKPLNDPIPSNTASEGSHDPDDNFDEDDEE